MMTLTRARVLRALGFVVVLTLVMPFVVFAVPQLVGANAGYVVVSGSMSPAIDAGDVVIVEDVAPDAVRVGDVVTYHAEGDWDLRTTHRVVAVERSGEAFVYYTKGDANEDADERPVPHSRVVGRVAYVIPFVGHVVLFAQTTVGIVVLLLVPAFLLVATELMDLASIAESADEEGPEADPDGALPLDADVAGGDTK